MNLAYISLLLDPDPSSHGGGVRIQIQESRKNVDPEADQRYWPLLQLTLETYKLQASGGGGGGGCFGIYGWCKR